MGRLGVSGVHGAARGAARRCHSVPLPFGCPEYALPDQPPAVRPHRPPRKGTRSARAGPGTGHRPHPEPNSWTRGSVPPGGFRSPPGGSWGPNESAGGSLCALGLGRAVSARVSWGPRARIGPASARTKTKRGTGPRKNALCRSYPGADGSAKTRTWGYPSCRGYLLWARFAAVLWAIWMPCKSQKRLEGPGKA